MVFVPVPNVASFELVQSASNQVVENVYNVSNTEPWTNASLETVCGMFKTWWDGQLKSLTPNTNQLIKIVGKDQSSQDGPFCEYTTGLPIIGTATGPAEPNSVTVAVKWTTAKRGRSYTGRTFHIGLQEGQVVQNSLETAALPYLLAAYQNLLTLFFETSFTFVVVSRYHDHAPRVTGVATPVLACSIDPYIDSQRRRLNGRGR